MGMPYAWITYYKYFSGSKPKTSKNTHLPNPSDMIIWINQIIWSKSHLFGSGYEHPQIQQTHHLSTTFGVNGRDP